MVLALPHRNYPAQLAHPTTLFYRAVCTAIDNNNSPSLVFFRKQDSAANRLARASDLFKTTGSHGSKGIGCIRSSKKMTTATTPKISVCLPTFNGAKYVRQAIDSILAQSFQDFELIVCDDRSSDDTPQMVRAYADRDDRVKFTTNSERLGLFRNYNECISKARGQ